MAWRSSGRDNKALVDNLMRFRVIKSANVEDAMRKTDRGFYSPRESDGKVSKRAYEDAPQPIGYGATISAPHMHAMCLETLKDNLKPGAKALDVGSGSGFLVAAMARMVGNEGRVYGIEHIQELVSFAQKNLEEDDKSLLNIVTVKQGDGRLGWPDAAPFDAIHVGAAAEKIPESLLKQLKPGGKLIIPVGSRFGDQELICITRRDEENFETEQLCGVRYVPLTSEDDQLNPPTMRF